MDPGWALRGLPCSNATRRHHSSGNTVWRFPTPTDKLRSLFGCRNRPTAQNIPRVNSNCPQPPSSVSEPALRGENDLLLDEYKILQAKIDKLGEDMFKVRSWCITVFSGILAGATLSGELSAPTTP